MPRLLALSALLFAILAAPAGAGTVSQTTRDSCAGDPTCEKYGQGQPVPITTFTAAPGETNSLTVTRDGDTLLVNDFASAVTAQAPCTQVDANTARCPFTPGFDPIPGLLVDAGDGDDAITVGPVGTDASLAGGVGNDTIVAGDGDDDIDGGLGDDKLNGGAGDDTLSYASRTEDVTVSLKAGSGGQAGETDTLAGFETLIGGAGVDVLLGGEEDETIDGGPGADNVNGGPGADTLFGGRGPDALRGGAGDDQLYGDPSRGFSDDFLQGDAGNDKLFDGGGRNTFIGGAGRDEIEGGKGRDTVKAGKGNDKVDVRGGGRDTVDCGKGRDRAKTDKKDKRKRCERR